MIPNIKFGVTVPDNIFVFKPRIDLDCSWYVVYEPNDDVATKPLNDTVSFGNSLPNVVDNNKPFNGICTSIDVEYAPKFVVNDNPSILIEGIPNKEPKSVVRYKPLNDTDSFGVSLPNPDNKVKPDNSIDNNAKTLPKFVDASLPNNDTVSYTDSPPKLTDIELPVNPTVELEDTLRLPKFVDNILPVNPKVELEDTLRLPEAIETDKPVNDWFELELYVSEPKLAVKYRPERSTEIDCVAVTEPTCVDTELPNNDTVSYTDSPPKLTDIELPVNNKLIDCVVVIKPELVVNCNPVNPVKISDDGDIFSMNVVKYNPDNTEDESVCTPNDPILVVKYSPTKGSK